jgi:hypothetical protein
VFFEFRGFSSGAPDKDKGEKMTMILTCERVVQRRAEGVDEVLNSQSDDPAHVTPENVTVTDLGGGRVFIRVGKQVVNLPEPPPPPTPKLDGWFPAVAWREVEGVRLKFQQANLPNPHAYNVYYGKTPVGMLYTAPPTGPLTGEVCKWSHWTGKIAVAGVNEAVERWAFGGGFIEAQRDFCKRFKSVLDVEVKDDEQ